MNAWRIVDPSGAVVVTAPAGARPEGARRLPVAMALISKADIPIAVIGSFQDQDEAQPIGDPLEHEGWRLEPVPEPPVTEPMVPVRLVEELPADDSILGLYPGVD
jgi:hypothetical protein